MKLDAIAVSSLDFTRSVAFYEALGFSFPEVPEEPRHLEAISKEGEVRLMIDSHEMMTEILGEAPVPANHSSFALKFDTPEEVDAAAARVKDAGFEVSKEPWDAVWGQRYATVKDPDGYMVDLFAQL